MMPLGMLPEAYIFRPSPGERARIGASLRARSSKARHKAGPRISDELYSKERSVGSYHRTSPTMLAPVKSGARQYLRGTRLRRLPPC